MGSVPVFQNPYGPNGNSPSQIDTVVGTAYEVVREVGENLEYIKHVSAHLEQVYRVSQSTDGIDMLYTYIEELAILLTHIEEVLLVAASLDEIHDIHEELAKLLVISDNITALADLYSNLDAILARGGTVVVSETPPVTQVQGKLWWENDSGNLFAWYDDGSSGQWVQINIASTSYDWTDILNKPSTFPPTNHTHAEDVKKIGDTMTGNLVIAPPVGNAQLTLTSVGNSLNQIVGQMVDDQGASSDRWRLILGNTLAESGGAAGRAGSDFVISRYTNSGGAIDNPIHIPRDTGIPNFVNGLTSRTMSIFDHSTNVATTAFVANSIASFNDIVGNTLTVKGQTVIHVVDDAEVVGTSVAWGNGLLKTEHKLGSTEGMYNTSVGLRCLTNLTTANFNTFMGFQAGERVTTGSQNTAVGRASMIYLTTGYQNTAVGQGAMLGDPAQVGKWFYNTGIGVNAMSDIKDTASSNTGVGWGVMTAPGVTAGLSGQNNSALGVNALQSITSGDSNNAYGYLALSTITTGNNNIGIGSKAGAGITTGSGNVIIGHNVSALTPTLSNAFIVGVENGTQVITGGKTGIFILGTTSATVPLAGYVGEYREVNLPQASDKTMVSGVPITICQMTLPPGDWDVYGWTGYTAVNGTTLGLLYSCLSLTPAALDANTPGASEANYNIGVKTGSVSQNYFKGMSGYRRMSISAADIVYLVAYASFSGGAPSCWGKIWARRMR
jgi:hypothetical protein